MPNQTVSYFQHLISASRLLNSKEEDILVNRLSRKKLKQLGRKHKLSIERIRQIENTALRKLSAPVSQSRLF